MAKETGEDILKTIAKKGGKGAGKAQEQVKEALGGSNKTPPPGPKKSSKKSSSDKAPPGPKASRKSSSGKSQKQAPGPEPKPEATAKPRTTGFAAAKGELSDLTNKIKGKFNSAKNAAADVVETVKTRPLYSAAKTAGFLVNNKLTRGIAKGALGTVLGVGGMVAGGTLRGLGLSEVAGAALAGTAAVNSAFRGKESPEGESGGRSSRGGGGGGSGGGSDSAAIAAGFQGLQGVLNQLLTTTSSVLSATQANKSSIDAIGDAIDRQTQSLTVNSRQTNDLLKQLNASILGMGAGGPAVPQAGGGGGILSKLIGGISSLIESFSTIRGILGLFGKSISGIISLVGLIGKGTFGTVKSIFSGVKGMFTKGGAAVAEGGEALAEGASAEAAGTKAAGTAAEGLSAEAAAAKGVGATVEGAGAAEAGLVKGAAKTGSSILSKIGTAGKILGKVATPLTALVEGYQGYEKYTEADEALQKGEITGEQAQEQKVEAVTGSVGGIAGALGGATAGGEAGAALGAGVGALFGGVGAVPGAAIGGTLGAIGGGLAGAWGGRGVGEAIGSAGNSLWNGVSSFFGGGKKENTSSQEDSMITDDLTNRLETMHTAGVINDNMFKMAMDDIKNGKISLANKIVMQAENSVAPSGDITANQNGINVIPNGSSVPFTQQSNQMAIQSAAPSQAPVIINNNNNTTGGGSSPPPPPARSSGAVSTSPPPSHIDRALYGDLYGAGIP